MKRRTFRVAPLDAGKRLASVIAARLSLNPSLATKLVARGAVYLEGTRCKQPGRRVSPGQSLVVVVEQGGRDALSPMSPIRQPLRVLFEDRALIALDKGAGVLSQPGASREGESLLDQLKAYLGCSPGLVHRLDRETSGVMVFGKTRQATGELAGQFRTGSVLKRYLAVAGPGLPPEGWVDLPIAKDPHRVGRYRALPGGGGSPAYTRFTSLYSSSDYSLVALYPKTGRTHQLRVHLKALGAPVAGDRLYGGRMDVMGRKLNRCLLHAQAVQIAHPSTGKPLLLEAPVPEDLGFFFRIASVELRSEPFSNV